MKLGSWMGCCLLSLAALGAAHAQSVRKTAEASMVLTGTVDVNPDGSLHGYTIDKRELVPSDVAAIVDKNVSRWTFKLSSPTTEVIHTKMSLLVLAKPMGDDKYSVTVSGSSFGENDGSNGESVSYKSHKPNPTYPKAAVSARVSGTAFLLLRIGRDGTVEEAVAEQVNLDQYGTANEMRQYRKMLADASLLAARQWTYNVPTHGKSVNDPYWQVRVPVSFNLLPFGERPKETYGRWHGYIPGPRETPPWISQTLLGEAPDAMPDDGLHAGNSALRLATPLGGS
ncbi:energy transducer TonB [Dyella amyloliquefaciens]|uniref:energy transducer TonB n=1 Tax=Dyella amyloliquefaciens TaxID=1770545 RepID=UPI00102E321E|nr:energy transducer TonB [Dyella amyloliquefaciens]